MNSQANKPDGYLIPAKELCIETSAGNSRFIATISHANSISVARAFLAGVRGKYPDASHHVPAYIIGGGKTILEYCSDDGEPAGTAGRPALAVLRGSGLGDVALIITRYFGGKLLGKGGLVKAYIESAQAAVRKVPRAKKCWVHEMTINLPYNKLVPLRTLIKNNNGNILSEDFSSEIIVIANMPIDEFIDFQDGLKELSSGKIMAEIVSTKEIFIPESGK